MKKILLLLTLLIVITSCGTVENKGLKLTKENIEKTYKIENRSLNLENKKITNFVNLNKYMSGTEVNNIYLGNNKIQIVDISGFEKLGKLEINNNEIRFIGDLRLPINIRHLNISNNNLTTLKGIEKYSKLKTIDISHNNLTDESFKYFKGLKNLKYINMKGNKVSEEILGKISKFNGRYLMNNSVPFSESK